MPRVDKRSPTYGIALPPGKGARARTYRLLIAEAMKLVKDGHVPSVSEVAVRSGVSRATAYRYFESRSKLISAVIGEGLAPVCTTQTAGVAGPQRLRELFEKTFPLFRENEPHMRAALILALEHEGLERAGLLEEEIFRRGHRCDILRRAASPLEKELGSAAFERLLKALSVIYGIEIYVVLKDIWGARDREVEAVARWMLEAILAAVMRERAVAGQGPGAGQARASPQKPGSRGKALSSS